PRRSYINPPPHTRHSHSSSPHSTSSSTSTLTRFTNTPTQNQNQNQPTTTTNQNEVPPRRPCRRPRPCPYVFSRPPCLLTAEQSPLTEMPKQSKPPRAATSPPSTRASTRATAAPPPRAARAPATRRATGRSTPSLQSARRAATILVRSAGNFVGGEGV